MTETKKRFRLTDLAGNDIGFGSMTESNVYVSIYPKALGKRVSDLVPGESAEFEFRLSGERGVYLIKREE